MVVKLYKMNSSPPARASMMACDLLKVPVEMIDVNLLKGEHVTDEFLKKNPMHTVPVLEDGDLILHDSHAILMYLAEVYDKQNLLYPKDLKQRALVDQKLFFNISILFMRLRNISYPLIIEGEKPQEKHFKALDEAYGFLEEFLSRTKYLAGNNMTIADIAAYATTSSLGFLLELDGVNHNWAINRLATLVEALQMDVPNVPIGSELMNIHQNSVLICMDDLAVLYRYPKLQAWMKEMEQLPCAQKWNAPGLKEYEGLITGLLAA